MKRRVVLNHLEWDLSAFSRVDSDYWDMEASIEGEDPIAGVGTDATGASRRAEAADGTKEENLVVVDDPPA